MGDQVGSTLLLLADGRFPAGGHAHSGGLEEAVATGRVQDEESLFMFLGGRLATTGLVESALAAAAYLAAGRPKDLRDVDAEAAARCPSPALREASRSLGRSLLRASSAIWPGDGAWDGAEGRDGEGPAFGPAKRPMFPVALGFVGDRSGLGAVEVCLLAAQASVSTPAWAATRLFGLDPFAVARCLAALTTRVEEVAAEALDVASAVDKPARLPALSSPLVEIGAEAHARWEVHLFAS